MVSDTVIGQSRAPIAVVSDNGSCDGGKTFQTMFVADDGDPLLRHVRTRNKSPQTNGVIERFFESLKYEHLFGGYIGDGDALNMEGRPLPHRLQHHRTPPSPQLPDPQTGLPHPKTHPKPANFLTQDTKPGRPVRYGSDTDGTPATCR